jgi:hypothetical protein
MNCFVQGFLFCIHKFRKQPCRFANNIHKTLQSKNTITHHSLPNYSRDYLLATIDTYIGKYFFMIALFLETVLSYFYIYIFHQWLIQRERERFIYMHTLREICTYVYIYLHIAGRMRP